MQRTQPLRSIPLTQNLVWVSRLFFYKETTDGSLVYPEYNNLTNFHQLLESNEHGWSYPVFVGLTQRRCQRTIQLGHQDHVGMEVLHRLSRRLQIIHTGFFIQAMLFFNPVSVLHNFFMNRASSVAQVLHNTQHHHTEKTFLFTIFVPRSSFSLRLII